MYRPTLVLLLICFFVAPLQINYKNFVQFDTSDLHITRKLQIYQKK